MSPLDYLTYKQIRTFNYIANFISVRKIAPSLSMIANATGLNSHVQAYQLVNQLVRKGYLHREPKVFHGLRILKYPLGAVSPTTDAPKTGTIEDARCRAAYARGVAAGRAAAPRYAETDPDALRRAYDRGYAAGQDDAPKTHAAAYDKGFVDGKAEAKLDLTMRRKYAE